MPKETTHVNIL